MTIRDVELLAPQIVSLALLILIGFIVWLFRVEIRGVLSRIRRGKVAGIEVELDSVKETISRLDVPLGRSVLESLPAPDRSEQVDELESDILIDRLLQQASIEPAVAIIRVRVEIERAITDLGGLFGEPSGISITPGSHSRVAPSIEKMLVEQSVPTDIASRVVKQIARLASTTMDYLSAHTKAVSLPASDSKSRGAMFAYLDTGIRLLTNIKDYTDFVAYILETVPQTGESDVSK